MRQIGVSIWCFLALICPGYDCIQILSMSVPEAVEAGSEDIVLDCDYEYTEEEKNWSSSGITTRRLVVEWYHNNDPAPIYQWTPNYPPRLISELLRGHLDLEFEVNEDPFKKQRALLIKNPLPQFSGTYTCKVSSYDDEDFDKRDLLIYAVDSFTPPVDSPPYPCSDYTDPSFYGPDGLPTARPLIIAHRGASGMYPEHTKLGYREAAKQGTDLIECDLEITKDLQFICAHEPYLSKTTDIHRKFPRSRMATYNMDDDDDDFNWNDKGDVTDFFSFDFTLEELRTVKKFQANGFRDPRYDYAETVVTLPELVEIVKEEGKKQGRTIGIYPEIKHPRATNRILQKRNIPNFKSLEHSVVKALHDLGYDSKDSPCYLQSFELTSLENMRSMTDLKLVFLLEQNITQAHWDRIDKLNLAGIGVDKGNLVTVGASDEMHRGKYEVSTTNFIQEVHDHGLKAHCFTFRNEWMKLYWDHGQDPYSQLKEFLDLGTDGYFSDFPLTTRRFMNYEGILCPSSTIIQSSSRPTQDFVTDKYLTTQPPPLPTTTFVHNIPDPIGRSATLKDDDDGSNTGPNGPCKCTCLPGKNSYTCTCACEDIV